MKNVSLIVSLCVPGYMLTFGELAEDPLITRMAAVAVMMSLLWISEAIPLAATSLLPLILFPILGIASSKLVAAQYMNSTVFLLVGGFMIALAMQRWNLHKRIALTVVAFFGGRPLRLMLGFVVATAFLSMWISNTATTLVMLPIALAIVSRFEDTLSAEQIHQFSLGLLLAIAYSASIGGMMTLVGTAPNLVFARIYEMSNLGVDTIGFAQWMMVGVPIGLLMLTITACYLGLLYLRKIPASDSLGRIVMEEKQRLGPMRREEGIVMLIFAATAVLWITRKELNIGFFHLPAWSTLFEYGTMIDDGTVAIFMSFLLFLIPARDSDGGKTRILSNEVFTQLPWSIVVLFGGGFALAYGFTESGLSRHIALQLQGAETVGLLPIIAVVSTGMTFLTELTSNTATTQLILPILQSVAEAMSISPMWLMLPATLSASCAFMFPVATPPNAIIFGSGKIHVIDMVKTGLILNLLGIVVIVSVVWVLAPIVFGISR